MNDKQNEIKIRLEQINEALQNNRKPFIENGFMVSRQPTLAEWAVEETVCVLLDILQEESEPCELFSEVEK